VEITGAATNDKVNATGALTANGTIAVTLTGYVPVSGDTFDIADASSITGTPAFDFSAAALTAGLEWDTTQFSTNGTIRVTVSTSDPFDAWAASYGLTGGKTGDDDGDGDTNLLEFGTNASPVSGSSAARAFGKVHLIGGENAMTLTVAVRKGAVFAASGARQVATKDMVVYTVEASDDLVNWNVVTVTELSAADAAALQATLSLPTLDADWEWHSFRTDDGTATDPRTRSASPSPLSPDRRPAPPGLFLPSCCRPVRSGPCPRRRSQKFTPKILISALAKGWGYATERPRPGSSIDPGRRFCLATGLFRIVNAAECARDAKPLRLPFHESSSFRQKAL
jgi:hypothetical protein